MNLDGIDPAWLWLIGAILMAGAELFVPGVFLIFLAAAAALTGLVAMLGLGIPAQLALFPLFALGTVLAGRRFYHRSAIESSDPLLNDRLARHVGETVTVVSAIEDGRGRVRLGDSVWPVRGADAPVGAKVRIVGSEGGCFVVELLPPPLPPPPRLS